ncbi:MAG: polysaccharide deacetylase family protein [Armatimonadetes bacterium]|nr:polysaccharide deacetylase family protein [Armatimonadota bacterium]
MEKTRTLCAMLAALLVCLLVGCSGKPDNPSPSNSVVEPPAEEEVIERITDRPGNEDGKVLIVMYHHIGEQEGSYKRSIENFRGDLQRLYDLGFRPVTLAEYADDAMDLPPGASPVILTWDDSNRDQFRYLEDGSIDPECGVGIWRQFAEEHPDFPVRGTFFVLKNGPFGADGQKKVDQLLAWGCEIQPHTIRHPNLRKLTEVEIMAELSEAQEYIRSLGSEPRFLSLPFGIRPENHELLVEFELDGTVVRHEAAVKVGAGPAPSPGDPERDLHWLPRIQAFDGEYGLTFWLDLIEDGRVAPYVQP